MVADNINMQAITITIMATIIAYPLPLLVELELLLELDELDIDCINLRCPRPALQSWCVA